jgi:hypothetical protein
MFGHQYLGSMAQVENGTSYQSHCIGDLGHDDLERLDALLLAEVVASILLEAGLGILRREAREAIGVELGDELFVGEGVGRTAEGPIRLARDVSGLLGLLGVPAFGHFRRWVN